MATPAKRRNALRLLHKIHLWVGLIVGIQLLLWTASGLLMTAYPIDQVRGTTLRRVPTDVDLRSVGDVLLPSAALKGDAAVERAELAMLLGNPVYILAGKERKWLVDARTGEARTINRDDALAIARQAVTLVEPLTATRVADPPPLELRRPGGAWMVADANDVHVYIGNAGEMMAVRTALWRWYDVAWGLHILDPRAREDTHHPILIASAALSLVSVITGLILIGVHYRPRRRA